MSHSAAAEWTDTLTAGQLKLDTPSRVNAATCVTMMLLLAFVIMMAWRHLPDTGTWYFGFSTRSVKITLLLFSWALSGTAVMMLVEGYTLGTSVYIMAQIVTTVGYGDFTPTSWYTQLFMSFYVILCILVIAGVISSVADNVVNSMASNITKNPDSALSGRTPRDASGEKVEPSTFDRLKEWFTEKQDVIIAATLFWTMVGVGTVYYGGFQGCTCSYGVSYIEGCFEETQEQCLATGGNDLTYMEAFYMSCITLTTVGFGDFTPMSYHGRIFGAFFMLIGVAAMGNFVRAFSEAFMMESAENNRKHLDLAECFHKIDSDGDGHLSRMEFATFVLLEHGLVTEKMLNAINAQYEKLDVHKNQQVTLEMILAHESGGKVVIDDEAFQDSARSGGGQTSGASALLRAATKAGHQTRGVHHQSSARGDPSPRPH